MCLIYIWVPIA